MLRVFLFDRKALTDPKRLVAVLVMIVMIVMTIVSATVLKNGILALIFCILQFLSYLWYCLRKDFKLMPIISYCDHFGFFIGRHQFRIYTKLHSIRS